MKKTLRKHILATQFWVEENEKQLTKTQVANLFNSDRHKITELISTYKEYINSARAEDQNYMFYFTEQEKRALEEYNTSNIAKKDILSKYHIGKQSTLNNWLQICGYSTKRHYKYDFNRSIFKEKPNPEMAYWLGFLLADGYIGKRSNGHLSVELHLGAKDKNHLIKFANFIQMPKEKIEESIKQTVGGAYTRDNIVYRFNAFSNEMANDLKKYNILQNKSLKEIPYIFDSEELEINYIRGLIDGDGYVSNPSVKNKRIGICGSKEICTYISDFFKKKLSNEMFIADAHFKQSSKDGKLELWSWNTTNQQATKTILDMLYTNASIYLDRKYINACAVIKLLN